MEERIATVQANKAGGTAGEDSMNYRISLPSKWVKKLGMVDGSREVVLQYDGESIVIRPARKCDPVQFLQDARMRDHAVYTLHFYTGTRLCTKIYVDETAHAVLAENLTDNIWDTAFGVNKTPTWMDYERFLLARCVPPRRDRVQFYLKTIEVDEYDPLKIIRKTEGRMAEDFHWIKVIEG